MLLPNYNCNISTIAAESVRFRYTVAQKFTLKLVRLIVTDLINALPGNSSVNTVQHATIEEAAFSVSAVTSRSGGWWSGDVCFL
jgi:hypothetical protein